MLIKRYQHNPILTKDDVPYPVATVHNAAVVKHEGKYIMVFRSHKLNGRSILGIAVSNDGYNFKVNDKPFMIPSTEGIFKEYEALISTTNKDMLQEIHQGRFRQDLYYRLSGVRLVISPLRERKDDLSDLVWHFVNQYAREVQRHIVKLDPAMMNIFAEYHWPGNIRQLRNVVRTSLILGVGQTLSLADVSWLFDELQPLAQQQSCGYDPSGEMSTHRDAGLGGVPLEQVERRAILDTLHQTGGNRTKAAKVLGISDRTLRDRMHRYRREGSLQPA